MNNFIRVLALVLMLSFTNCANEPATPGSSATAPAAKKPAKRVEWKSPSDRGYHFGTAKEWLAKGGKLKDTTGLSIILAVNRTDSAHLRSLDTIIVPNDLSGDVGAYMLFPQDVPGIRDIDKIIFFSYPAQAFGAYENGYLVQAGPTNMGRKKDPTPTGLFFSNWKAVQTTSTFNDEWDLRWNFNIENKEGVGWHQYALPGYPASHSCLRLQENDAKKLYEWADQWKLEGADKILANGTPTVVYGSYAFDAPKPWLQLVSNADALEIRPADLESLLKPDLDRILKEQQRTSQYRDSTSVSGVSAR